MNRTSEEMICKETEKEMLAVKAEDLEGLYEDMVCLYEMVSTLIEQWNEEEELRERHRPYLNVRKNMKKMCENYLLDLEEIAERNDHFIHTCKLECHFCGEEKEAEPDRMLDEKQEGEDNLDVLFHKVESILEGLCSDFFVMVEYVYKQHSIVKQGYEQGKIDSDMMDASNRIMDEVDAFFKQDFDTN